MQHHPIHIRDKAGREYTLKIFIEGNLWHFDVRYKRIRIGEVLAIPSGETLRLQDIHLKSEVLPPIGFFRRNFWFLPLPERKPKTADYRYRGLGNELMRHFLRLAREHGFQEIIGEIKPNDFNRNPKLPDWYRRHGFSVNLSNGTPPFPITLTL